MELRLGGSGTDSTPTNEVGDKLRAKDRGLDPSGETKLAHIPNSVKELTTDGHTHGVDVAQELPSHSKTLVDLEGTVDIGVIDETLPANSRSGLFTINRHRLASSNTFVENKQPKRLLQLVKKLSAHK